MWTIEDDPLLRSTILGIALLDQVPERAVIEQRVRRAIAAVPALRHRVESAPLHRSVLEWIAVDEVDLGYHLRHVVLPAPGTFEQVLEVARVAVASGFDRSRPLWEFTVIEGLDDPAVPGGARAVLLTKAHHVVADGIGAIRMAANLFDLMADPADADDEAKTPERLIAPSGTHRGLLERWRDAIGHDVDVALGAMGHQARSVLPNLLAALRDPAGAIDGAIETARSIGRTIAPVFDTKSPVMVERRAIARYQTLEVPLEGLRAAAHAAGGTLNDAFVAAIAGGLRRYHDHHGAPVAELRMAMPISLRAPDDGEGGNHVSVQRFGVPIDEHEPAARVRAVAAVTARVRAERSLAHTEAIAGFLNLLPSSLIGTMLKHVDFFASNFPGVPVPMYFAGAEVLRLYPFGPTAGSSLNVTLMSYRDLCCIGVHSDTAAIPDGDVFHAALIAGFDEVLALA